MNLKDTKYTQGRGKEARTCGGQSAGGKKKWNELCKTLKNKRGSEETQEMTDFERGFKKYVTDIFGMVSKKRKNVESDEGIIRLEDDL